MPLPTLHDFLKKALANPGWPDRSHVRHRDFKHLYVRLSARILDNVKQTVIDLASLEAKHPGKGAFTALIADLRKQYPTTGVYVECVVNARFRAKLLAMGFRHVGLECYFLDASLWQKIPLTLCDLCSKRAIWRHPAGGIRCGTCPRPGREVQHRYPPQVSVTFLPRS